MPEIGQINRTNAKLNPGQVFESPEAIVGEVMMTRGEKLATLERWAQTTVDEMNASSEGMRTGGMADGLVQRLDAITRAMKLLKTPDPVAEAKPPADEVVMASYSSEVIASTNEDFPFIAVITNDAGTIVGEYPVRTEADGQAKIEEMLRDLKDRQSEGASDKI